MDDPNMLAYHEAERELVAKSRTQAILDCVSVLLGERQRLLALQRQEFEHARMLVINKLDTMARRLRKMK